MNLAAREGCCVTASRNPVATKNHVACSSSEPEKAEHQTNFAIKERTFAGVGNWQDIRAAFQFTSITSGEQRAHMQVSSSDNCERTILFTVSIFAKGQINEYCLLRNVESCKSWSLPDTSNLVLGRAFCFWCCCVTASRNPIATSYQESRCLILFQARMSRALNKFFHAGKTNTGPSSMSRQSCQLMGHWCHNPVPINHWCGTASTHLQVSSIDHCERIILFTVSVCANGEINE